MVSKKNKDHIFSYPSTLGFLYFYLLVKDYYKAHTLQKII